MRQTAERLPIRTISALTGVKPVTLRAWERRYGLIRPQRTAKGHRVYTHAHVERIRRVLALLERGVPVGRAREVLDATPAPKLRPQDAGPWPAYRDRMSAAIARFDEAELDEVYDELLSVYVIDRVTQRVMLPMLVHLGARWRDVAGGVAEEHFFAMYMRSKLGARMQLRLRHATGPQLVAACAPGEHHEIGLMLFSLEAQAAGLRTVLLGADTPLAEVAIAFARARANAVVISSSVDPAPALLAEELPQLVQRTGAPVFVGGSTAIRHRRAIEAAGAIALAGELEDSASQVAAAIAERGRKP